MNKKILVLAAAAMSGVAAVVVWAGGAVGTDDSGGAEGSRAAGERAKERQSEEDRFRSRSMPIQQYLPTRSDELLFRAAKKTLIEQCMIRRGVKGFELPEPQADMQSPLERRYGLSISAEAREYGYDLPPSKDPGRLQPKLSLSKQQNLLFFGAPTGGDGGCVGEAGRKIGIPKTPVASKIQIESWQRSMKDPRVESAFRRWSACMEKSGFTFANPMDTPGRAKTSAAERKTLAGAEVACNYSSGVLFTWLTADSELQEKSISEHGTALQAERREVQAAVARAKRATTPR
ncbi:hypothetical protein ABZ318_22705 [Streptomyces sp. NPDC006197]|uniref:hypothetical protein n=1 Tax=Streptomyces sp. NPDC006197 TaxID=3156685 RepID=UPI0033B23A58